MWKNGSCNSGPFYCRIFMCMTNWRPISPSSDDKLCCSLSQFIVDFSSKRCFPIKLLPGPRLTRKRKIMKREKSGRYSQGRKTRVSCVTCAHRFKTRGDCVPEVTAQPLPLEAWIEPTVVVSCC